MPKLNKSVARGLEILSRRRDIQPAARQDTQSALLFVAYQLAQAGHFNRALTCLINECQPTPEASRETRLIVGRIRLRGGLDSLSVASKALQALAIHSGYPDRDEEEGVVKEWRLCAAKLIAGRTVEQRRALRRRVDYVLNEQPKPNSLFQQRVRDCWNKTVPIGPTETINKSKSILPRRRTKKPDRTGHLVEARS